MMFRRRKKLTAVKGVTSAVMVSILIHAAILLLAGMFVAVTAIRYEQPKFEGREYVRPKTKLKRLQLPVNIEQKATPRSPDFARRITAPPVYTHQAEFELPAFSGTGGMDFSLSDRRISAGDLSFAVAQFNLFGVRSRGEKVLFILDTSRNMMIDEIGGIPAYQLIKDELTGLLRRIPPTTLFNVIVFEANGRVEAFTPELNTANEKNIEKLKRWIDPLNSYADKYGMSTLGYRGTPVEFEPLAPVYNTQRGWMAAVSYGIQRGVDSIYWLGTNDGVAWIDKDILADCKKGKPLQILSGQPPRSLEVNYDPYGGKERWERLVAEARKKYDAENKARLARGRPIRVLPDGGPGNTSLVQTYFPGVSPPGYRHHRQQYSYTARDITEYVRAMREKYDLVHRNPGFIKLKRRTFSLHVIHFVGSSSTGRQFELSRLKDVSTQLNSDYARLPGLDAIRAVSTSSRYRR